MYYLLFLLWFAAGGWLAYKGFMEKEKFRFYLGIGLIAADILFFSTLRFWGETLWFQTLGYSGRFWIMVGIQIGALLAGAFLGGLGVYLLTMPVPKYHNLTRFWPTPIGAIGGALWGVKNWQEIILYLNGVTTSIEDPIFGINTGFYLFSLPFYGAFFWLLLWIILVSLAAAVLSAFRMEDTGEIRVRESWGSRSIFFPLFVISAALSVVVAFHILLNIFHLLYSKWGVVSGPGWTDVHVRLPTYIILIVLVLALGFSPLIPAVRGRYRQWLGTRLHVRIPEFAGALGTWGLVAVCWILLAGIVPAIFQWLLVEPNEITYEKPYIENNIEFTRRGFRLHEVEERQFPVVERFTREMADENQHILSEVRLWDWRALSAVYNQFQEIRLYYEFPGVDIDRYTIGDRYRQVMVSAREMNQASLPEQSQTFVNKRFKYTHGYGVTLAPVRDFTPKGLPDLLVKDIPPVSAHPDLRVNRPEIYYGELTRQPVIANSSEKEFDYPSGDENVYIHYPGQGGVQMTNFWRKFIFGWMFDGTRLLFSTYPTEESRMMFHRQIRQRVAHLAPFLEFDEDPYIVLANGRLFWIIDAYTTSSYYPYSEPFFGERAIDVRNSSQQAYQGEVANYLHGVNYVRNSVKAVVDAFNGSVDFYVFEPEDPVIQAWQNMFPGLFKPQKEMPEILQDHIRYPQGFLLAQGLVYAKYHMKNPEVFYNQEDLWVRATEKYRNQVQPVEPYYVMWQLPRGESAEFVQILPFTPKNRQVLIGWIAGMCDGENYGRFLAYQFPKGKRVIGPQQVETKIDQDSYLSGQLTLWDQRGSNVIRGNVLAIPLEQTLLYVEPIYLEAETAAYPELRLVVVMHGDTMSYAENFEKALEGLFEGGRREIPAKEKEAAPERQAPAAGDFQELAQKANQAFEEYLRLQNEQQFEQAARQLQQLRDLLQQMAAKKPLKSTPSTTQQKSDN